MDSGYLTRELVLKSYTHELITLQARNGLAGAFDTFTTECHTGVFNGYLGMVVKTRFENTYGYPISGLNDLIEIDYRKLGPYFFNSKIRELYQHFNQRRIAVLGFSLADIVDLPPGYALMADFKAGGFVEIVHTPHTEVHHLIPFVEKQIAKAIVKAKGNGT